MVKEYNEKLDIESEEFFQVHHSQKRKGCKIGSRINGRNEFTTVHWHNHLIPSLAFIDMSKEIVDHIRQSFDIWKT